LHTVLTTLPVGVLVTNREADVILGNPAYKQIWGDIIILGRERRAQSKGFWHDSGKRIDSESWASARALSQGQTSLNELIDIETFDGRQKTIQNSAAPIRNSEGSIIGAVVVNEDVSERVSAESALRKSERILREAEKLGHTGSWEHDLVTGEIFNTEENLRLFFGDNRSKRARFEDYVDAIHPDDRPIVQGRHAQLLAEGGPRDIEFRVVWPDGSVHILFGRATVVRDDTGRATRIYGTNVDITERKQAEQALQNLSRRLLAVQEEERRHLARELHDEVGQLLTGLRLLLKPIGNYPTEVGQSKLEQAQAIVDKLLEKVRGLSFDLRPAALDQLGLIPALLELVDNYTRQTGVLVSFKHKNAENRFAPEVETTAYRIVQEALTNVARHAGVGGVTVRVWATPDLLSVQIEDRGRGFDPEGVLATSRSSGVAGMRERVTLLDGQLTIDSRPGDGTQITAELPLGRSTKEEKP
jgi:signal transduction histidine kinase